MPHLTLEYSSNLSLDPAASLTALNLLDRKYLGLIDSGDLQTGTTNYYPGTPRTLMGKLALSF